MNKNIWKILDIEKTKDQALIKNAYRNKLVNTNPEDDPEGFMALRKAYEEAIDYSKKEELEEEEVDKDSLTFAIDEIYKDFSRRIDVAEWEKLFDTDWFVSLELEENSIIELLAYFMNNCYIPNKVMQLLVERFEIKERKQELCEVLPLGFIDHIINNATYDDCINYYMFDMASIEDKSSEEIDEFICAAYDMSNALQERIYDKMKACLDYYEKSDIKHPFVEVVKIRADIMFFQKKIYDDEKDKQDREENLEENLDENSDKNSNTNLDEKMLEQYSEDIKDRLLKAENLYEKYQDCEDLTFVKLCGDLAYLLEDFEKASYYFGIANNKNSKDYYIRRKLGQLYLQREEYENARDIFIDLLEEVSYDVVAHNGLTLANEGLMRSLLDKIEKEPENQSYKLELAWCYYRNSMFKETIDLLETFTPSEINVCEYQNLLGRNYMYSEQYEEALEHYNIWLDAMAKLPDDEANRKQKSKFQYANFFVGDCYLRMKDYDEARKFFHISISKEFDEIMYAYEGLCRLEYDSGNYEECIRMCEETLLRDIDNYEAAICRAKALFELEAVQDCMDACERAIRICPYFTDPYILEIRLYNHFEQYEDSLKIIERVKSYGIDSDAMLYYEGYINAEQGNIEEANKLFEEAIGRFETGNLEEDANRRKNTDLERVNSIRICLAANYQDMGEFEKAINMIKKALDEEPDSVFLHYRFATLNGILNRDEIAVTYYDKVINCGYDTRYTQNSFVGKAAALSRLMRFDEARDTFEKLEEQKGIDDYYVIDHAELLVRMNRLSDATSFLEMCIQEKIKQKEEFENNQDVEEEFDYDLLDAMIGNLCCFYGNEGKIEEAYNTCLFGEKLLPNNCMIYRSMGCVYLEHAEYKKAKELLQKAFENDVDGESYVIGALLLAIEKMDDVFHEEYKKYVDFGYERFKNVKSSYGHLRYAEFLRALGKYEEALKEVEQALSFLRGQYVFFREYHEAWFEKGHIYKILGDKEKAKECYQKAKDIVGHSDLYQMYIEAIMKD